MLNTQIFGERLKSLGFNYYSGVPCSFLKDLINYAINDCEYIMAANEGDCVSIATGAYIGGRKSVVLMQNSGLTNAVSPLTSLNYIFKIPVLGFVSLRGEPGVSDEPQHELMGAITSEMLELMKVKWEYLSTDMKDAEQQLKRANAFIENKETFFFVVKKNTFESVKLNEQKLVVSKNEIKIKKNKEDQLPTRLAALELLNKLKNNNTVIAATTGTTGRELYEIEDAPNNIYMVGSLGCISSIGLGLADVKKDKDVIVIDGDGSLLMRMGSLATNAYYHPKNMLHILLDNNSHDSTGGQATVSHNVDYVEIAASVGYPVSLYAHNLNELERFIKEWQSKKTLTFITLRIAKGSKKDLGRPKVKPYEVAERLIRFLK
jgi:phosphonopyruvate decarboxylase